MSRIAPFLPAALAAVLAAPVPASAALILVTQQTNDAAFELAGGFLQTYYGLPLAGVTALPPLERAVAQFTGSSTSNNVALYVPNATTGIPGQGAGVTQALTNVSPAGSVLAPRLNGTGVAFTYQRVGTTITYTQGTLNVSVTAPYFGDIDGIELRARSAAPTGQYRNTGISYSNLRYTDAITSTAQVLPTVAATDGSVLLMLYAGVVGDFTLTGLATLSWGGPSNPANPPGNSNLNAQVKGLDLPAALSVPEPASVAMLGLGVLALAGLRRRG